MRKASMQFLLRAFLLMVAVLGVAAGLSAGQIPRLAEPQVVKFGMGTRSVNFAGFYIAIERGYFKDANITNDIIPVRDIGALMGPIATGQLDVGASLPIAAFFNAIASNVTFRVVAPLTVNTPGFSPIALIVRKDLIDGGKIRSFADLKGRSIAVTTKNGSHERDLLGGLMQAGLTLQDVNMVYGLGFPQMNVALATGTIDAAMQTEPLVTVAIKDQIAVRWKGADEMTPNRISTFFIFSEQFAARTDLATAWMVAYLRGVRDYVKAQRVRGSEWDKVIEILIKHTPLKDRGTYDQMVMPAIDPNGEFDSSSIEADLDYYIKVGTVNAKTSLGNLIDRSFVKSAVGILGPYPRP